MKKKECKEYCHACNEYVDFEVKTVNKTIQVKGETLNVNVFECFCTKCGEEIFVYEYEKLNDIIVFDEYKKKVGLLTSKEIKEIRRKREMTQIELARFIGIGDKDITRYESGSIQNKCIDKLLKLVQDDASYEEMVRVFYEGSGSIWFNAKPIKMDFGAIFTAKAFQDVAWSPYQKIINNFNDLEREFEDHERERRNEVQLA